MAKQAIPAKLIFDTDNHSALFVWVKLHSIYKHPIFYNFSYAKLSEQTGISHTSLRKYIPRMIEMEWCSIKNGKLVFKGLNKFHKNSKYPKYQKKFNQKSGCILIPVHKDKNKQILEFRNAVIRHNIEKQKRQVNKKLKLVSKCNSPHARLTKSELKYVQKNNISRVNEPNLSNQSFGKLINKSMATGRRLQEQLKKAGLIKTRHRYSVLKPKATKTEYRYFMHTNLLAGVIYLEGVGIVKQEANAVAVVHFR